MTIKRRKIRRNTEWWAKEKRGRRMKWRRKPGREEGRLNKQEEEEEERKM